MQPARQFPSRLIDDVRRRKELHLMSWLKIDYWYHVLTYVGGAGLLACIPFKFEGVSNKDAMCLAGASLFIGIGEWINHPHQEILVLPNFEFSGGGKITSYHRQPRTLGQLFDVLGFVLLLFFVYRQYAN
jgi:hypothetical protein